MVTAESTRAAVRMRRRLLGRKVVPVAIVFILLVVAMAIFAPLLSPYDPMELNVRNRLSPPSAEHWLGTDGFGRDVLSRIVVGARVSLLVSLLVVTVATVSGTLVGLIAGYFRSLDGLFMRATDALMSFPEILLAISLMAALGPSMFNVVLAISAVYLPRVARIVRAATLVTASTQYSEAARSLGASSPRIILKHVLPNLLTPVIIQATFVFAYTILAESALSFLGVGVPPEIPTWGNMVNEGRELFGRADWLILVPGTAIVLTVVAFQVLGDGLRDMLDPKLRDY